MNINFHSLKIQGFKEMRKFRSTYKSRNKTEVSLQTSISMLSIPLVSAVLLLFSGGFLTYYLQRMNLEYLMQPSLSTISVLGALFGCIVIFLAVVSITIVISPYCLIKTRDRLNELCKQRRVSDKHMWIRWTIYLLPTLFLAWLITWDDGFTTTTLILFSIIIFITSFFVVAGYITPQWNLSFFRRFITYYSMPTLSLFLINFLLSAQLLALFSQAPVMFKTEFSPLSIFLIEAITWVCMSIVLGNLLIGKSLKLTYKSLLFGMMIIAILLCTYTPFWIVEHAARLAGIQDRKTNVYAVKNEDLIPSKPILALWIKNGNASKIPHTSYTYLYGFAIFRAGSGILELCQPTNVDKIDTDGCLDLSALAVRQISSKNLISEYKKYYTKENANLDHKSKSRLI